MTTTDDLRQVLRAQAAETLDWPAPRLPVRRPRTSARLVRPVRPVRAAALVLATAVVVLAIVLVPRLVSGPGAQQVVPGSPPTSEPDPGPTDPGGSESGGTASATPRWKSLDCPGARTTCATPYLLQGLGQRLTRTSGGSVPTVHGQVSSRELSYALEATTGPHYVLVGATGSGPSSRLSVDAGGHFFRLEGGRLNLISIDDARPGTEIVLREDARVLPRETLVIKEYVPTS